VVSGWVVSVVPEPLVSVDVPEPLVSLELVLLPPEGSVPESVGAMADTSVGDWVAAMAVVAPAVTRSAVLMQDAPISRGILRRPLVVMTMSMCA
ncbi:hypothetical protein ACFZDP_49665, partial [Streptomyces mirabilis]|uniref:hypothetical protein n=1 Tax=Streptomyces mirabilis TaxID=68239 RepID=UPI0036E7D237